MASAEHREYMREERPSWKSDNNTILKNYINWHIYKHTLIISKNVSGARWDQSIPDETMLLKRSVLNKKKSA